MNEKNSECCPKFNPEKWDEKTFNWDNKKFIKESLPTFFHMPFPPMIAKKITKMWKMAEKAQKTEENKEDVLILFTDPHPFKSEMYLSVTGEVPQANNTEISGNFIAKVFDGQYNAIPKFMKEMNEYLDKKGKKAKKYYIHYAYCPKCAKKFGNNYMILFAQV
ncbi:MAG: hypothetical protein GF349_02955 [Candidatus Magasanikbacteria bacterium]|nr:hypothetical protein [Candidatus Magasanikbacteria bacterium]